MENQNPEQNPQSPSPTTENSLSLLSEAGTDAPSQKSTLEPTPSSLSDINTRKKILLLIFSLLVLTLLAIAFILKPPNKQNTQPDTKNSTNPLKFDNNNVYKSIKEKLIQTLK